MTTIMSPKEYREVKAKAKEALNKVKMPYKQHVVKAAYRVSKSLFSGQERLLCFWDAIRINAPMAKGWSTNDGGVNE